MQPLLIVALAAVATPTSPPAKTKRSSSESAVASSEPGAAPKTDASGQDLAEAAHNPVTSMIGLPLQNETSYLIGPNRRTQNVLDVQPVIPVALGARWSLVCAHHRADRERARSRHRARCHDRARRHPRQHLLCAAGEDDRWLVPVGAGIGRIFALPRRHGLNVSLQAYWNAVRPDPGPPWTLRVSVAFLFPAP